MNEDPQEAKARLAAVVESSTDAIIAKNLHGIITSWNAAAEQIFGYTADEAIGQSILLIIPPEAAVEENQVLERIRRGERVPHFDTVRLRKDGRRIDVALTISPIRAPDGTVVGASKIARDVSDRKRLEREHAAALAEAQAASKAKDEFLAMLGHELRNPLAAISGAAQALGMAADLEETKRPRQVIDRQLDQLARLVDNLMDAAQVQAGEVVLQTKRLRLGELLRRVVPEVVTTGHLLELDIDDELRVNGDPERLRQVIHNLLANAVQYTPRGGRIRVRATGQGEHAVVQIADEGIGIAPEMLPRVFELFVQAPRTLDRSQGGLGIGLTLARKLVELHGGTLTASSSGPGTGSVFTVRIPRLPSGAPAASPPRRETRRVLVVEDNEDTREMFKMVLTLKGHDVLEAADGAEAVDVALREKPEIAFVDIGLPVMDGYEVARELRRKLGTGILLIAVTGYGQPEDEACALRAGFDEHAVKPLAPARLAEILRREV